MAVVDPLVAREADDRLRADLALAPSNDPDVENGARLYERDIRGPHPLLV